MSDFILNLFVKNKDISNSAVREKYGAVASVTGIFVNIMLFLGKFIVGTLASSVSITADAINNLSDAGSSIISFVSFKISGKPADRDHPFGHARFEYVASMIVSFIIMLIGFELLRDSIAKIINPQETIFSYLAVAVLCVSILMKLWLFVFYKKVSKKIDSTVMVASSADSLSDVLATSAVLVSLFVMKFTGFNTDGYIGIAVAIFILISGFKIMNETKNHILGTAPDHELILNLVTEAKSHSETLGVHDLVVHNYGPSRCFASMHVEVDGNGNIFKLHDVIDNIERDIQKKYGVQCSIHLDPIQTDDEAVNIVKIQIEAIISAIDNRLSVHDFRMVPGDTHTNLIFDLFIPFEIKMPEKELKELIDKQLDKISHKYYTVITFDRG
ncbi:MAG: cation diffusion facilitator family transporter [Clostridia bacterium]